VGTDATESSRDAPLQEDAPTFVKTKGSVLSEGTQFLRRFSDRRTARDGHFSLQRGVQPPNVITKLRRIRL